MKKRDKDELHGLKEAELVKRIAELAKQIREGFLDRVTKEVKNKRVVKELRRKRAVASSILRMKTLMPQKEGKS